MSKVLALFTVLLLTLGCGGDQFASDSFTPSVGGSGGSAASAGSSGSPSEAGTAGEVAGSPGEAGMGGTPQGGSAGQPGGGAAGVGGPAEGGGAGIAGSGPAPICTPFAIKCTDKTLDTCAADGSKWASKDCDFACSSAKGCFGACTPGSKRCEDGKSESCSVEGEWVVTQTCAFICSGEGACGGSCVPGAKKCDGLTTQSCSTEGGWVDGETCDNVCSMGVCTGSCAPGTKQCNDKTAQTCQANGTWKNTTTCPFICEGSGSCVGECIPGEKRCSNSIFIESCDITGHWQTESSCPFICSAGSCGGICKPGTNCNDDGNECTNDVCSADGLTCNHPNRANGTSCGSSNTDECDHADTCQAGTCQQNFEPITTACSSDGNSCTKDVCSGSGFCNHPAGNAGVICRAASCENGVVMSSAACTGSDTSCPASASTECYGSCNMMGNACEAPATKVDDAYSILATDNDASYLYASVRTSGGVSQILKYGKADNAKTVLYQDTDTSKWLNSFIVAGPYIYFGETTVSVSPYTGRVLRISISGTTQAATFVSSDATVGFAKNSTHVYWSDARKEACSCASPGTFHIYSTTIGGTSPTTFGRAFTGQELSPDIEVDESYLYVWTLSYTNSGAYSPAMYQFSLSTPLTDYASVINAYFIQNSVTYDLVATYSSFPGITKNGAAVFGNVDVSGGSPGTLIPSPNNAIFKVQGGTSTLLTKTSPVGLTRNFAADTTNVYIDNMKMSVAGGTLTYFTNHSLATPNTLTIDGSSAYFGSYGYWTSAPYTGSPDVPAAAIFKSAK